MMCRIAVILNAVKDLPFLLWGVCLDARDKLGFGAHCALPIAAALLEPDGKVILPVSK